MTPERDPNRALYVISVAAELAGVHPQTLRLYERKGLISPQRTRGNNRRYSDRDVERLRRIQQLTDIGVSLAGVRMVLDLEDELRETRAELERLQRDARAAAEAIHRHYRRDLVPVSRAIVPFRRRA